MTKRTTKVLAAIMALVMVLAMTGCAGTETAPATQAGSEPAAVTAVPEAAAAATPVPAASEAEANAIGTVRPTATTKDTIVIAQNMDPGTMDPYAGSFGPQLVFTTQTLETLFLYDPNGNVIPWLAESVEYGENNMEITLKLREGVTFHNGDPMTAEDVVFSFQKASESAPTRSFMGVCDFANVTAIDDLTVHVPLTRPSGTMADTLTNLFVVNKNVYDAEHEASAGFTGTGPWKVKKWEPGVGCTYEAYEGYWDGAPIIKNLEIRIITEASVRMIELENGNIDINKGAGALDVARVANGESAGVKIWRAGTSQACHFLGFNCAKAPFDDVRVRQAFCYALDTQTLALTVFENIGEMASSLLPNGAWYSPDLPEDLLYTFNPEKAKELLAEAGYPDGITVTMNVDSNAYRLAMAEQLPSMLAKSGITIEINPMESAAYNELMLVDNNYDVFLRNFGNLTEPGGALRVITSSVNTVEGNGNGYWHYAGTDYAAKIDELLNAAGLEPDTTARADIYAELCTLWAEQALSKPIADFYDTNLVNEGLQGMFYSPNINVQYAYFG